MPLRRMQFIGRWGGPSGMCYIKKELQVPSAHQHGNPFAARAHFTKVQKPARPVPWQARNTSRLPRNPKTDCKFAPRKKFHDASIILRKPRHPKLHHLQSSRLHDTKGKISNGRIRRESSQLAPLTNHPKDTIWEKTTWIPPGGLGIEKIEKNEVPARTIFLIFSIFSIQGAQASLLAPH